MEEEKDYKIAFLDVLVTRNGDRLATSVYRKPTHTETYIRYMTENFFWGISWLFRADTRG